MSGEKYIYLDNASTTKVDPRVLEKMLPYFTEVYGNASSRNHPFGWKAKAAIDKSRNQVAEVLKVEEKEIIFTSGATEAINIAIKGTYSAYQTKGNHIITVKTEHKAVLDVCERLEKQGATITYLDVNSEGLIDLEHLENSITDQTLLVSIMWANNETGTIQPVDKIGAICKRHNVLFFSDATQAVGKVDVNPRAVGVDMIACSAHKFYGPKGAGALYISGKDPVVKLHSILDGGGHERGIRSGTLNVPGIVGFGEALMLSQQEMTSDQIRLKSLRDRIEMALLEVEQSVQNSRCKARLPHIANISFKYIESEAVIATFNQSIALSTGSACTSATLEPSHVLLAQGCSEHIAHSALRISLGRFTTNEEIEKAIQQLKEGIDKVRLLSPIWQMHKDGIDVDSLL